MEYIVADVTLFFTDIKQYNGKRKLLLPKKNNISIY